MWRRLLPRETSFFDYFEKHAALVIRGARALLELVADSVDPTAKAKEIKEIEHEADVVTHACVEALHKTFITPIERDAIHHLITRMDDIMDYIEAAADRIALYQLRQMTPEAKALADVLVRAGEAVAQAVRGLGDMKNRKEVLDRCIDINRLENEGDTILRNAVAKLFREATDPIMVIKWKEVYEDLENATDRCEDVANIIEGVVLDHG
jgi:hypothetical protein